MDQPYCFYGTHKYLRITRILVPPEAVSINTCLEATGCKFTHVQPTQPNILMLLTKIDNTAPLMSRFPSS